MRYVAAAFQKDERPVQVEGKAKPKGGWRAKSGMKKLGKRAQMETKTFGEAVTKAADLIAKLSPASQKKVVKLVVMLDKTDVASGANPFGEDDDATEE